MSPRRRRVTLEDVAREAGVSMMTVSRVINNTGRISNETRDRVRDVIVRLDYRPSRAARTLVTNQTFMIGVVVPDITNPYFAEIVQGIEEVAWEQGYSVLLANTNEDMAREKAVLGQLEDSTVDGIVLCSPRLPDDALIPLIEQHQAVVAINRPIPHGLASVVRSQYVIGARALRAAEHLIQSGRQRIGYLQLKRSVAAVDSSALLELLEANGLPSDPDWCVTCAPNWDSGYTAGKRLLERHPELDAVIGGNDLVALGAMRAAIELGWRIPDDLAITGGDDILLASQVTPPLTTFRVSKYAMGAMAARLLFQRMAGNTEAREFVFEEELIVRESAP